MDTLELRGGDGPLYRRIVDEVRWRMAEGALRPGDRLPPTRELARTLGTDPNTVARAYSLLKHEGLLDARQGRGTFITTGPQGRTLAAARDERLHGIVRRAIGEARGLGYDAELIRAAFEGALTASQLGDVERTLSFQGSHDPALDVLWALAGRADPGLRIRPSNVGSLWGLVALERGEAQLAGAHLFDPDSGEYNLPWIRRVLSGRRVALLHMAGREQGLMYRREEDGRFAGLADVARRGVRFVNRQRGSGTRILLDHHLRLLGIAPTDVGGYDREELTHSAVAAAVAGGAADAGLGTLSAARALGLGFLPVATERYDLVALADTLERGVLAPVLGALRSAEFRALLDASGGYDTTRTGEVRFVDA